MEWLPGDRIRAVCRCGAEREFDAAAAMWGWLVHHPHLRDQGRMESTYPPSTRTAAPVVAEASGELR